ncbi:MAG: 3-methyl-2-oxobutanoate hydroxymethyltransferase [Gammaproteobacteria bacterium]|nr:3-methyl-2-oxobutanoate hydroxymethyltransferase [Gammaproteobacteria bacterium]
MNIYDFAKKKLQREKITMMTCYEYTAATIIEKSNIDCVLVGDSAAMVMHGHADTTTATLAMMISHTQAVAKGLHNKFLIADLPFMSYRRSLPNTMDAIQQLVQAGAHAVKLEGAKGNFKTIQYIVESGVPVMGHIGLTPQFIHNLGGFKVQGKNEKSQRDLLEQAQELQQAGCFAIVLECMPSTLAKQISDTLSIPTIGIGAGPHTDGQVLVWHDMLGLQTQFTPKFLKRYLAGQTLVNDALNNFVVEVHNEKFPQIEHCY